MEILHSRENAIRFFEEYARLNKNELENKVVFDLSAGSGYIAGQFASTGAMVRCYDLFPQHMKITTLSCEGIDLQKDFPIPDGVADLVVLSETLECLPNQFHFFKEASRILKDGGKLIVTAPNPSSLRSRFSQFIAESEHYSVPMPDETNAYVTWPGTNNGYFNKIFISGILRIRTLAGINGLRIAQIHKTPYSSTAVLFLIFYPFLRYFSWRNRRRQTVELPQHKSVYDEIYRINTSMTVLLSKHLVVEFRKSTGGRL